VTLAYAHSIDGSIAFRPGRPLAISGRQSRTLTHTLRALHDAILVGIGTILADNPRLTVRHARGQDPQPVIIDSRLRLPQEAHVLHDHRSPVIIAADGVEEAREASLTGLGARVLRVPAGCQGLLDLAVALQRLRETGITSVMVEGGAQIITSFLRERLVDQLVLTLAPMYVGGLRAVNPLQLDIPDLPHLGEVAWERFGDDLVLWAQPLRNDP
jgi:3,4-dihydroxy 2-butanone 4-phosphate synthase/GTP cyclohydrolase II